MRGAPSIFWLCLAAFVAIGSAAAEEPSQIESDRRALAGAQTLVGNWRGVGQPKRGSSQGAWTEEAQWSWHFADGRAELVGTVTGGKYFDELRIQPGAKADELVLVAQSKGQGDAAKKSQRFAGSRGEDGLVFTAAEPQGEGPARITFRLVAGGDRLLALFEKRLGPNSYARLAEIGSTRQGSSFAKNAVSGPECIVTGGLGTIAVEHNGKKYFVCCTGCRDLFNDDPEAVLADYQKRKAADQEKPAP